MAFSCICPIAAFFVVVVVLQWAFLGPMMAPGDPRHPEIALQKQKESITPILEPFESRLASSDHDHELR